MIIKLDKSIFIQFLHMCNWQKIERISKNGPESTFLWVCEVFYKILTFLTFDFWLPMKSYWNWTKHIPYAHIKKIKKIMIIKLDKNEWHVIGIGQTIYTLANTTQFGVDSSKVYCKCHMVIASCNTLKIQQGANALHRGFSYWICNPN